MTRRELALDLLEKAGEKGVTTGDFLRAGVGSRYSARVLELRQEGFHIESERLRDSSWRYTLRTQGSSPNGATPSVAPSRGQVSPPKEDAVPLAAPAGPGKALLWDYTQSPPVYTEIDLPEWAKASGPRGAHLERQRTDRSLADRSVLPRKAA